MKLGVPIVSTPLGVEGMHVQDGIDGLVARSPEEFARKAMEAYTDCRLWQRLMLGGYQNIKQYFSIEAARPAVLETVRQVGAGPQALGPQRSKCRATQRHEPHVEAHQPQEQQQQLLQAAQPQQQLVQAAQPELQVAQSQAQQKLVQ